MVDLNTSKFVQSNTGKALVDIITLDKKAKYLPISKETKLFFVDSNSTNRTDIYAVEKIIYKGEYYFNLLGTGYYNNGANNTKKRIKE